MAKSIPNDIHQYSLLSAYTAGLNTGGPPTAFLAQQGTHGLGICEDEGGDMILLDSEAYSFAASGSATLMEEDEQIPFVMVTAFAPQQKARLPKGTTRKKVREGFERGKNTPMPFRIVGRFAYISTKQETYWDVRGTIFGFYLPDWQRDISGEGVQCCYLSEDRERGGRVADFETGEASLLEWARCGRFHLGFPQDEEFQQVRLRRASVSYGDP